MTVRRIENVRLRKGVKLEFFHVRGVTPRREGIAVFDTKRKKVVATLNSNMPLEKAEEYINWHLEGIIR